MLLIQILLGIIALPVILWFLHHFGIYLQLAAGVAMMIIPVIWLFS